MVRREIAVTSKRVNRGAATTTVSRLMLFGFDELRGNSLLAAYPREAPALASHTEIELAEKRGELVLARDVESKLVNTFAHCKTKLLGVAARARQGDPALTESQIELFENLVRDALEDLARGAE